MFSWFQKKETTTFVQTDIHSHILPGLDDGATTIEDSLILIKKLCALGFKKLITTPHIITGHYDNTRSGIQKALGEVRQAVREEGINVEIEAAAEYYVDETFIDRLAKDEELLSFGQNYVLIETGFINIPHFLPDLVFNLKSKGYKPVLAHPERYIYLQENKENISMLRGLDLKFQLNASSFTGHYSEQSRQLAHYLVDQGFVEFVGSDAHRDKHIDLYKKALNSKNFQKCRQLPLFNNAL